VITDSAGVVRYVLSGTWDNKMEGAHVINGDEASAGQVLDYITGPSLLLWQRRYPPYVVHTLVCDYDIHQMSLLYLVIITQHRLSGELKVRMF